MKTIAVLFRQIVLLTALPILALPALADQTWNGSVNNQWNVGANWSGIALPLATDAVIYNNLSTLNLGDVLGQDFTIQGILLSNAPGAVAVGGANTLTLTPTTLLYTNLVGTTTNRMPLGIGMSNATQNLAITVPVALGSTQAWVVASGQTLDISGAVSGGTASGLYKDGLGTLMLEGASSFTGGLTVNAGSVWINNSAALGGGGSTRNITIANNALGAGLHLNGTNGNIILPTILQFTVSQNLGTIFNEAGDNVIPGNMYVTSGGGDAYFVVNAGTLTMKGPISTIAGARSLKLGGAANGTYGGAITSTGLALHKLDGGTWTLTNNNTYTGITSIEGGTLALGGTATIRNTPSIVLSNNATLDVSALTPFNLSSGATIQTLAGSGTVTGSVASASTAYIVPGNTNTVGTLTFTNDLSLPSATAQFELNTATTPGSGINDLLNVGGNLDAQSATVFITQLSPLTSPGTYRLVNYNTESSGFNPTVTTDTRYTFTLADSGGSPGYIDVNVTGSNGNLIWSGGNGETWDLNSSANWNSDALTFYNYDAVTFDDSTPNNTVSITTTVRPTSVSVAGTANYLFQGSGKITGATGLTKSGTGTLTLNAGNCDFTGPVTVNAGVVSVGTLQNSGSASSLGTASTLVLNGGTFQYTGANLKSWNRFVSLGSAGGTVDSSGSGSYLFLTNTISGSGSLTKIGTKQLIIGESSGTGGTSIAGNNTYTGNTYISQGEVQIRNVHALGSGKAVVASGTDLAFGGGANYGTMTNNIDLNGDGPSPGSGALQVNDASTTATFSGTINLLANSSVGSQTLPGSFTIAGPIIGPGLLTKQSHVNCTVILTCPTNSYSGGTLVNSGGALQLGSGGSCGSLGSGPVTDNGTLAYNHSDSITNNSAISGTGNLTHTGAGTLTLGGANTYAGTTTVNGGTVAINGSLAAGAVTVANGATLGGYGTIGGPVTVQSGGTLALGASVGTLNVNNILNLAGTTVMKINKTGGVLSSDLVQGVSILSYGGLLKVTATGDPLGAGDSFKLFNATTNASNFSSTNLPALTGGLFWDTSSLTNSGTIRVSSSGPVISSFKVLNNKNFQLTFSGSSGANYRVWANTNAAARPVTNTWTALTTNTFGSGPVTFTDTQAPNFSRRFYVITSP